MFFHRNNVTAILSLKREKEKSNKFSFRVNIEYRRWRTEIQLRFEDLLIW